MSTEKLEILGSDLMFLDIAVSTDIHREAMQNIHAISKTRLEATDGHRLHIVDYTGEASGTFLTVDKIKSKQVYFLSEIVVSGYPETNQVIKEQFKYNKTFAFDSEDIDLLRSITTKSGSWAMAFCGAGHIVTSLNSAIKGNLTLSTSYMPVAITECKTQLGVDSLASNEDRSAFLDVAYVVDALRFSGSKQVTVSWDNDLSVVRLEFGNKKAFIMPVRVK